MNLKEFFSLKENKQVVLDSEELKLLRQAVDSYPEDMEDESRQSDVDSLKGSLLSNTNSFSFSEEEISLINDVIHGDVGNIPHDLDSNDNDSFTDKARKIARTLLRKVNS